MISARTRARRYAVQALYQWQLTGQEIAAIVEQFGLEHDMRDEACEYFDELARGVVLYREELDDHLAPLLERGLEEVDPVERAIVRLGAFELAHRPDIPYRVVINEAVELAKTFGAEHGHRFVNGVMDRLAAQLRAIEVQAARR